METLLSPKQLARAIGISESSLKRWVDQGLLPASRTSGGHRRISVSAALSLVRSTGLPVLRPDVFGIAGMRPVRGGGGPDLPAVSEPLYTALREGRGDEVRGLILGAWLGGAPVSAIADGPVTASMHRIGELWKHSDEGIFFEHRATELIGQALQTLRTLVTPAVKSPRKAPRGRSTRRAAVALGGAPPGDPYVLPSVLAAAALSENGYDATNLSGETPLGVLGDAAEAIEATVVWVAMSVIPVNGEARRRSRDLLAMTTRLAKRGTRVVVGGRGVPAGLPAMANLHVLGGFGEMATLARMWRTTRRS